MGKWRTFGLTGLIFASTSSAASAEAVYPSRSAVIAAINLAAERDLMAYLSQYPPGTSSGHIIPVKKLTQLVCASPDPQGRMNCHFVAHYSAKTVYHIATLERADAVWRIVEDHSVTSPPNAE